MTSPNNFAEAINRVVEGEEEEPSPEDIHITAPKDPEVNPEVYKDVETLLFQGFLTLYGEVNGVPFIFKSLNHHEHQNIQWVSGNISGKGSDLRYYATFIAYGIFMVDGENILLDRERWVPKLVKTFETFPAPARAKIVQYLSEVNRRASNAVTLAEAYQMEAASRFKWAQLQGLGLGSTACTGIVGSANLGLNYAQLVWRALNHYEDIKDQTEREWDHSKFIGGCFVGGKEIRKVHSQDQERRKKERETRLERKDKIIRLVLLGENPEVDSKTNQIKIVARTVEELASQLERDLRGEKDWHDEIVAKEEAKIRAAIQDRQSKLQQLIQSKREDRSSPRAAFTDMVGLTKEEIAQRVVRRRQLEAQEAASRIVHPELTDERMSDFNEKYIDKYMHKSVADRIQVTDRDPSEVLNPPVRPPGTPFRR